MQTGFGALLLLHNPRYRGLVFLLTGICLLMLLNLLEEVAGLNQYFLITPIFTLSDGPLFYLFIQQLVFSHRVMNKMDALHFVPAILCIPFTQWPQLVLFFGTISHVVYGILGYRLIRRYHMASRELISNAEEVNLHWVSVALFTFIALGLIDYTRLNLQPYLPVILLQYWYAIMLACYFVLVSTLIYMAVRQQALFSGVMDFDRLEKKATTAIDDRQAKVIFSQVEGFLQKEALYTKPRLSLRDLALALGLQEKEVSWAINTGGNTSFCDYINRLRVHDVKESITSTTNSSNLLEQAFASGFNSKSSFNAIFRKEVGMTPSQYLRKNKY